MLDPASLGWSHFLFEWNHLLFEVKLPVNGRRLSTDSEDEASIF